MQNDDEMVKKKNCFQYIIVWSGIFDKRVFISVNRAQRMSLIDPYL